MKTGYRIAAIDVKTGAEVLTMNLNRQLFEAMLQASNEKGLSVAQVVRKAVRRVIDEEERWRPGSRAA